MRRAVREVAAEMLNTVDTSTGWVPGSQVRAWANDLQQALATGDDTCQAAPEGWRCTRLAGHSGSCAAVEA